jgi:predicted nucleic acid-binding protein
MLLYLDASALVKKYVAETGSPAVRKTTREAAVMATSILSRVEVIAAFGKAMRVGTLDEESAAAAAQKFRSEWAHFVRIQATELLVANAEQLAWRSGLRGYDAVHLASALLWQESMHERVVFATYDRKLWQTAASNGLSIFPEEQP